MWAFERFPGKIEYILEGKDGPIIYQVKIFGYLQLHGNVPNEYNVTLVCFRQTIFWAINYGGVGDVCFLPIDEFEERYKKFKLIES